MIEQLKADRPAQIIPAGIVVLTCLACAVFAVTGYRMLALISGTQAPVAQQPAANGPSPAATPLAGNTPLPTPEVRPEDVVVAPSPGAPTATPPGEEIVDPNYLQGEEAYRRSASACAACKVLR
jgi:hypothetical protein